MFQAAKHEEKTPGWGQALNLYQMVADAGMNRMLPPVKVGLELAMNRSMFNDKPIKNFDGELKKFAGISMTPETEHVLKSFRPFQTVNRIEYALENQDSIYPAVSGGLSGLTVQSVNLERTAYASRRDLTQALMKAQYALNRAEREGDITEQGRLQAIIERYQARIEQLNEHLKR